jgi:hypothetical protein
MLTDRMASPPAWTPGYRGQACRSGVSAIAAEAFMYIAGSGEMQRGADARVIRSGRRWGEGQQILRSLLKQA